MLSLPPEEMRRLGYEVVDRIVEHFATVAEKPPLRVGEPTTLRAAVGGPAPEMPGPSNSVSWLADMAAAGLNAFAGSWTATIERMEAVSGSCA